MLWSTLTLVVSGWLKTRQVANDSSIVLSCWVLTLDICAYRTDLTDNWLVSLVCQLHDEADLRVTLTFPDFFHFPGLFPDHFGIPWLFQVFQVSGHPDIISVYYTKGSKYIHIIQTHEKENIVKTNTHTCKTQTRYSSYMNINCSYVMLVSPAFTVLLTNLYIPHTKLLCITWW